MDLGDFVSDKSIFVLRTGFGEKEAGKRIAAELQRYGRKHRVDRVADLVGAWEPWTTAG